MKLNKKKAVPLFSYVIAGAIFSFLISILFKNWHQVKEYDFSFDLTFFLLGFAVALLHAFFSSFIWRMIVIKVDAQASVDVLTAFKIYNYSLLGKYVPGKIFSSVGRVYFGRKEDLSARHLGAAAVFELAFSSIAEFTLGLFFLILFIKDFSYLNRHVFLIVTVMIALGVVLVHPKVTGWLINSLLRKINKEPLEDSSFPDYISMLRITAFSLIPPLTHAFSFALLSKAVLGDIQIDLLFLMGGYIVSALLGHISFIVPAGLGVREGFLVIYLKKALALPLATFLSLLSRVWFVLADMVLIASTFLIVKLNRKR